jgi:hypothetical protein
MNPNKNAEKDFIIDIVPEPENLEDVVYSLMVNPNLSTINYFNDFSDQHISPESLEDTAMDESGIFELDSTGQSLAMTTHAYHHHLADDPKIATEILISRAAVRCCALVLNRLLSALFFIISILPTIMVTLLPPGPNRDLKMLPGISILRLPTGKFDLTILRGMGLFPLRLLSV